jgi:hypothetical protein
MKKEKFIDKLRSAGYIISILIAAFTIFEAFLEVESRALQNKTSINTLNNEVTDMFTKYHLMDVRVSKLETISDLQVSRKML